MVGQNSSANCINATRLVKIIVRSHVFRIAL